MPSHVRHHFYSLTSYFGAAKPWNASVYGFRRAGMEADACGRYRHRGGEELFMGRLCDKAGTRRRHGWPVCRWPNTTSTCSLSFCSATSPLLLSVIHPMPAYCCALLRVPPHRSTSLEQRSCCHHTRHKRDVSVFPGSEAANTATTAAGALHL